MPRTLTIVLLLVVLLLTGGAIMLYLAYGVTTSAPGRVAVPALEDTTRIAWQAEGLAIIDAESEHDAYTALGYVHGFRSPWNAALWRQVALGRLAEWFGDDLLEIDQMTHRLGLVPLAREAYGTLPEAERGLLVAYSNGLNAALTAKHTAYRSAFVLSDVLPEPWQPWHTLAVERLLAWMATSPPNPDSLAYAGEDAVAFFQADRRLRRWLHLHGFENSVAWAVTDTSGTHLFQRHVSGASALPFVQEVSMAWPGMPRFVAATVPGSPLMPAGRTQERAWAVLLHSPLRMVRTVEDTTAVRPRYERLVSADGTEHLITTRRTTRAIYFTPPPRPPAPVVPDTVRADTARVDTVRSGVLTGVATRPPPVLPPAPPPRDSTWSVEWPGFEAGTDWAAWRTLLQGPPAPLRLFDGGGLLLEPGGNVQVYGTPQLVQPLTGSGIFVANSPWARYAADRLDTLLQRPPPGFTAHNAYNDRRSPWAAALAQPMVRAVTAIPEQPAIVTEALTYLRNWDYSYDRASIAASIFDRWVATYRDSTGKLPTTTFPDSLHHENVFRYRTLVRAVAALAREHGTDLSQWRWEKVQPHRRYYPGWSIDATEALPARYAPLDLPGYGHPSTLAWSPSPIQRGDRSPAYWEAWTTTASWANLEARRYRFDTENFFGRYLIMDRLPETVVFGEDRPAAPSTVLVPPARPARITR